MDPRLLSIDGQFLLVEHFARRGNQTRHNPEICDLHMRGEHIGQMKEERKPVVRVRKQGFVVP